MQIILHIIKQFPSSNESDILVQLAVGFTGCVVDLHEFLGCRELDNM